MKQQLLFIILLIIFSSHSSLFSQGQANNWYFGTNAGITFNTNPPSALTDGVISTSEGCAVMSDQAGNLLFYSDGIKVWDKNHQQMPNGNGLLGHPSAAQSAIIIPKPGSQTNYIIITVPETGSVGMCYSEVDLSLNGGLGDVLTSNKNTLMFAPSSEKVTAVKHANDLYYWVVGRYNANNGSNNALTYVSYLVDCNGVDLANPVISQVGINVAQNWGYLVASPDGSKLASASSSAGIEVADFNNATGQVSNTINLGSLNYASQSGGNYGVAFSPNSKVLYASSITNWALVQWDVTAANIPSTLTFIDYLEGSAADRPSYRGGALQLGPDGKIYACQTGQPYLGVINNPNVLGTGCNLVNQQVSLGTGVCRLGLPPFIQSYFDSPTISYTDDCPGENTQFTINGASYLDSVKWNFGDIASSQNTSTLLNPQHIFPGSGTYNVQLIRYLACASDTVYRNVIIRNIDTTNQTITLCEGGTYELPDHQMVNQTGSYTSVIQSLVTGCDSVVVTQIVAPQINFSAGNDQGICKGNTAQLQAGTALNYTWSPSNTLSSSTIANPVATPTTTTTYSVTSQVQIGNNLVTNGDFELGYTGFTSAYNYYAPGVQLDGPGYFTVSESVPNGWWANCGDHTSGTGNLIIADGANGTHGVAAQAPIWCQTISVAQNTDYAFSTWLTNSNSSGQTSQIGFFINGVQVGNTLNTPIAPCGWNQFYVIWNSGNNSTIDICIREMSGAQPGNDYAIDDIEFYQICTITDDVTVYVSDMETTSQVQNVDCNGNNTGAISTQTTGGLGTYTYDWNTNQNTANITNLPSGNYTLTVKDSIGCETQISADITEPDALTASAVANNMIECSDSPTGSATVTVQGGTTNYTITWDNQETGATATQLNSGTHQVNVKDANGCTVSASVTIEQTQAPTVSISTQDVCLNTVSTFNSQANAGAGNQITNYQWNVTNNGQSVSSGANSNLETTLPQSGSYTATLTVTSSNNCTAIATTNFIIFPNPTATIEQSSECFQTVDFEATGQHIENLSLTYAWDIDNNNTIESEESEYEHYFINPQPTDVRLIVTDSRGCKVEVIEPADIMAGKADVIFPNVLSMKSTVGNDKFDFEKIVPNFNNCISYTLTIVNRWGITVFEVKNDKSNPDLDCSECFKGIDNKGKALTSGTYFYELKGDYGINKSGFITLIND